MNFWLVKAAAAFAFAPLWSLGVRAWIAPRLATWNGPRLVAIFALSRLVPCTLAMVVLQLGYPQDAMQWGRIAQGLMWSPYSPGFNAMLTALWWIVPSPIVFMIAMIGAETAAFAIVRRVLQGAPASRGTDLLVFWLVNPLSLFHIALNGQDEALVLLFASITFWAVERRGPAAAGVSAAAGVLCTKVLGAAAAIPLFVRPARDLAVGLGVFAGIVLPVIAILVAAGVPMLMFRAELHALTSGNIWVLPELAGVSYTHAPVAECAVAAAAIAVALFVMRRRPLASSVDQSLRLTGVVGALFMLLSPKAPTAWLLMFLPGVFWLIGSTSGSVRAFLLFAFLPVAVFEPSLWFLFDQGARLDAVWWGRGAMLAADGVLLAGYGWLAAQGLRRPPNPAA